MIKRFLCLFVTACLLGGCSSSTDIMHSYVEDGNNSVGIAKANRLESFSQGQIYLKDNSAYPLENVTANQALVFEYNGDNNPVILCKNAYQGFEPGFLTRLIAATMVAESSDIYESVKVTGDIFTMDPSYPACGFINDDIVTVRDLLYGSTIFGKCDSMIPLALYYSKSIAEFTDDINEFLQANGCEQSKILNMYGAVQKSQQINIYDLYLILPKILGNQDIYTMLTSPSYTCEYRNNDRTRYITMLNYLPYYFDNGYITGSGLNILGGITNTYNESNTEILTIAQSADGRVFVAFVNGAGSYENAKSQMEILLGKILN